MPEKTRISLLNKNEIQNGEYILYWMQSSVRTEYNYALDYALEKASLKQIPLVVYFGIYPEYPESNQRHLKFMLDGLSESVNYFNSNNIRTFLKITSPEIGAVELGKKASLIVTDCGYLRNQRKWRKFAASKVNCPLIQIESDVIVPVRETSQKEEWSAATIRKKINQKLPLYLKEPEKKSIDTIEYKHENPKGFFSRPDIKALLELPEVKTDVKPSDYYSGGYSEAKKHLKNFIEKKLVNYSEDRNFPEKDCQSNLSPYLHFGQISPLEIALEVINSEYFNPEDYLEQLIVRRELAINYVTYNPSYDSFRGLPEWCRNTLNEHISDKREIIYTEEELEKANTHDKYWNAAQNEMKITGKMHGYMRMYWGKKIIEWSESPQKAFNSAIYLNNKYSLDGRDPNSYAGVAWCFGKHDRPWKERPVFGKTRYMNDSGLKRKFDIDMYVQKVKNYT